MLEKSSTESFESMQRHSPSLLRIWAFRRLFPLLYPYQREQMEQEHRLPYRPLFSVDRKTWGRNFRWWLFRDKTGVVLIKDKVQGRFLLSCNRLRLLVKLTPSINTESTITPP